MAASDSLQRAPAFANVQRRQAQAQPAASALSGGEFWARRVRQIAGRSLEGCAVSAAVLTSCVVQAFPSSEPLGFTIFGRVHVLFPLGVGPGEGLQRFNRPSPWCSAAAAWSAALGLGSSAELRRAAGDWCSLARWPRAASTANARRFRQPGMRLRISSAAYPRL